ncbi:MAG: hypothetical protein AAFN79_00375 [Pseudomonadota bacterium]
MTTGQVISLAALTGLAACAPRGPADPFAASLTGVQPGVYEVSARLPADENDSRLHCAAARQADAEGMAEMNWIEGLIGFADSANGDATYRYFASKTSAETPPEGMFDKVIGGPLPISTWLGHCRGLGA